MGRKHNLFFAVKDEQYFLMLLLENQFHLAPFCPRDVFTHEKIVHSLAYWFPRGEGPQNYKNGAKQQVRNLLNRIHKQDSWLKKNSNGKFIIDKRALLRRRGELFVTEKQTIKCLRLIHDINGVEFNEKLISSFAS